MQDAFGSALRCEYDGGFRFDQTVKSERIVHELEDIPFSGTALVAPRTLQSHVWLTRKLPFLDSYEEFVYQKDLGHDSLSTFRSMERYNPDKTWRRTDDNW